MVVSVIMIFERNALKPQRLCLRLSHLVDGIGPNAYMYQACMTEIKNNPITTYKMKLEVVL